MIADETHFKRLACFLAETKGRIIAGVWNRHDKIAVCRRFLRQVLTQPLTSQVNTVVKNTAVRPGKIDVFKKCRERVSDLKTAGATPDPFR